ncbi:hypothetical protein FRC16_002101 [Serendipita sp. 398]|nr:hypothetical protein FRC16_002101 [Serendipita sp. 398]
MQVPASETKHVQQLAYHFTRLGNNNNSNNNNNNNTGGTNGGGSSNGQKTFLLNQRDDHGLTNGTTLWLGGQVLSHYLASILLDGDHHSDKSSNMNNKPRGRRRKRAIELGSGIGLTALVLYSMGWDVCATDVEPVLTSVLRPNILINSNSSVTGGGSSSRGGVSPAEPWDEEEDDGDAPPVSRIECRELDWTVPPDEWTWEDPVVIASHKPSSVHHGPEEGENGRGKGVSTTTSTTTTGTTTTGTTRTRTMSPPYDLIVSADTLYTPDLVAPLFRTIQHLARLSPNNSLNPAAASSSPSSIKGNDLPDTRRPSRPVATKYSCPIYVAVERRDPLLMDAAYEECQTVWGFKVERVRGVKIRKALEKAGVQWKRKTRRHRANESDEEEEAGGGGEEEEELPWDGVEIWKMRLPIPHLPSPTDEERK